MDTHSPLPEIAAYLARQKRVAKVRIPLLEDLTDELRDIVEHVRSLTSSWNPVELYTADPWSIKEEREKFLKAFVQGQEYQPRLTYSYAEGFSLAGSRDMLLRLLEKVRLFTPRNRTLKIAKIALFCKIKDDLATCDIVEGIKNRNDIQVGHALQYKYPGTDAVLISIAQSEYERHCRNEHVETPKKGSLTPKEQLTLRTMHLGAEDMKKAFEWALMQYGMLKTTKNPNGFQVVIDERATAIDVRDKSVLGPTVYIPASSVHSGERLLALMAHEIEGHARQSANGERLFLFGGGPLKVDDETLYEGLAMRHEHEFIERNFGTDDGSPFPDFYVFAIYKAEMGSCFQRVCMDQLTRQLHVALHIPHYESLPDTAKIDPDIYAKVLRSSWGVTYRVMRGHTDMQNRARFAMPKDAAYLRGWILDRELRKHGYGHMNEAAISAVGYLRILAEFSLEQTDLPYPHKDVTTDYMHMLLHEKPIAM